MTYLQPSTDPYAPELDALETIAQALDPNYRPDRPNRAYCRTMTLSDRQTQGLVLGLVADREFFELVYSKLRPLNRGVIREHLSVILQGAFTDGLARDEHRLANDAKYLIMAVGSCRAHIRELVDNGTLAPEPLPCW